MKLKNLVFGLMAAVAFTACSDNDDYQLKGDVDASISFGVSADLTTKADPNAKDWEANIKELTAIVFDMDGKLVAIQKQVPAAGQATVDTVKHIKVKIADYTPGNVSTTQFQIVLVANAHEQVKGVTSLANFKKLTTLGIANYNFNAAADAKPNLPMASQIMTISGLKKSEDGVENWVDGGTGPVKYGDHDAETAFPADCGLVNMIRLVSRVELVSLSTDFKGTYAGATFVLDSVYLVNVRNTSLFASYGSISTAAPYKFDHKTATFQRGGPATFEVIDQLINPAGDLVGILGDKYGVNLKTNTYPGAKEEFVAYMFENQKQTGNYSTRLYLSGELILANNVSKGTKYYSIELDDSEEKYPFVTANTVYKINATITGEGSDKPDEPLKNACIAAKVVVLPWNVVNQIEDDVN